MNLLCSLLFLPVAFAAADEECVVRKVVDQRVEYDSTLLTRRFVLTNEGLYVRLAHGRHYMVLTEHGYDGLGPSDNVIDIKNEGEYGMQMYYTKTMKQGLRNFEMHQEEIGIRQKIFDPISTRLMPDSMKKAFRDGPNK